MVAEDEIKELPLEKIEPYAKPWWENIDEMTAILGIIALAGTYGFWIGVEAKEVVVGAIGLLGGYIGGRKTNGA